MARVPNKMLNKYVEDTRYNVRFDDFHQQATDQYSIRNPFGLYFESEKLKYMVKLLNHEKLILSGRSVLDIGCHYGYHLNQLAAMRGDCSGMCGIDIVDAYIDVARKINPGMEFKVCQSLEEWPDGFFDLVSAIYVLSEIPVEDGYRAQFLRAIAERQKSGGYLLIMNFRRMPRWAYKVLGKVGSVLGGFAPSLAKRIEHICALSLERNLDDQSVVEQFADYRLLKSHSFMFFFGRDLYLKYNLPISLIKLLGFIVPVHKYVCFLLQKK